MSNEKVVRDNAQTLNRPKLTVTHTAAGVFRTNIKNVTHYCRDYKTVVKEIFKTQNRLTCCNTCTVQ